MLTCPEMEFGGFPMENYDFASKPDYFPVCDYYFLTKSWRYLFADKTGFAVFWWKHEKTEANMLSVNVFNLVWKLKFIQENERRKFQKNFLPVPKPRLLWFSTLHGWGTDWFETGSRLGDQVVPLFSLPPRHLGVHRYGVWFRLTSVGVSSTG